MPALLGRQSSDFSQPSSEKGRGRSTADRHSSTPFAKRSKPYWPLVTFSLGVLAVAICIATVRLRGDLTNPIWRGQQPRHAGLEHLPLVGVEEYRGKAVYIAANGVFPQGCKWREVQYTEEPKDFWAVDTYEFWHEGRNSWGLDMPVSCQLTGNPISAGYPWKGGTPHSQVWCESHSCVYQNLWYNNGTWVLLVGDGNPSVDWWSMTPNVDLLVKEVDSTAAFAQSVNSKVIPGSTLILDFPFFHHPTAIGHWGEIMHPLYSIFQNETDFDVPPDQFVLLHLKRSHLLEWARGIIAATLGLGQGSALPKVILQKETDDILSQVGQPLEGFEADQWLCFERCLVASDLALGGMDSFFSQSDARSFRALVYANHGLPPPRLRVPPRVITYQRKRANRRVVNEDALLSLLRQYGRVQVVEFNASTPLTEQLGIIAGTGVLVSVHTSNLANAHFLQPGSAVFEIIHRNWFWAEMDLTFKKQTLAMGDIHHYAWRALHRNQTVYLNESDSEQFGNWTAEMCETGECVEAHTNVDVVVDVQELRDLLDSRMPLVFGGATVEEAELPWPGRGFNYTHPFQQAA